MKYWMCQSVCKFNKLIIQMYFHLHLNEDKLARQNFIGYFINNYIIDLDQAKQICHPCKLASCRDWTHLTFAHQVANEGIQVYMACVNRMLSFLCNWHSYMWFSVLIKVNQGTVKLSHVIQRYRGVCMRFTHENKSVWFMQGTLIQMQLAKWLYCSALAVDAAEG